MKTPFPYFIDHALIACIIATSLYIPTGNALAGCLAGAFFYIGREVRDHEKLGFIDWPGFIAPIIAVTALYFVLTW